MSSLEMEMHGNSFGVEVDPQHILQSEALQETLLVMERTVIANILQPKLAAYKQLPVFEGKSRYTSTGPVSNTYRNIKPLYSAV